MIKKCLFPAAGYGTRFLPATKSMPKEMMPIVNKPLIEYGVDEALEAGLDQICIVTGRGKRAIENHFDINFELEYQIAGSNREQYLQELRYLMDRCSFSYTRQKEVKGLGDAILTGEILIDNQAFAVVLADDLCLNFQGPRVLSQMVEQFKKFRCSIVAVQQVPDNLIHKYGVVVGKKISDEIIQVESMTEKPDVSYNASNLAIIGRYILTADIFDILKAIPLGKNGELQLTDALCHQAQHGRVMAYNFNGIRFDCGNIAGFIEATNYYYQHFYKNNSN